MIEATMGSINNQWVTYYETAFGFQTNYVTTYSTWVGFNTSHTTAIPYETSFLTSVSHLTYFTTSHSVWTAYNTSVPVSRTTSYTAFVDFNYPGIGWVTIPVFTSRTTSWWSSWGTGHTTSFGGSGFRGTQYNRWTSRTTTRNATTTYGTGFYRGTFHNTSKYTGDTRLTSRITTYE